MDQLLLLAAVVFLALGVGYLLFGLLVSGAVKI